MQRGHRNPAGLLSGAAGGAASRALQAVERTPPGGRKEPDGSGDHPPAKAVDHPPEKEDVRPLFLTDGGWRKAGARSTRHAGSTALSSTVIICPHNIWLAASASPSATSPASVLKSRSK